MKRIAVHGRFLLLACIAGNAAWGQQNIQTEQFFSMVKERSSQQCEAFRLQLKENPDDSSKMSVRMGIAVQCDCFPAELDRVEAKADTPRELTRESAMALVKPVMETCVARAMRTFLVADCPDAKPDPGIKDQKAYCDCLGAGVAKLPDQEVAREASEAHADFETRVAARRDHLPDPPKRRGLMDAIGDSCRAAQGAVPKP